MQARYRVKACKAWSSALLSGKRLASLCAVLSISCIASHQSMSQHCLIHLLFRPLKQDSACCQMQMEAERALLAASLAGDPWAARFLLLSESCIPLYPASVVWMQLISHQLDRLYIDLHRHGGIPGRS